ncbi:MAG: DNA gyrase subunit A [Clostridiales bacterium]|nr:DNA gyrase subunit A [Clostridiales bacterium]
MDGLNQVDKVVDVNLEEEMKTSYINYAMSVIVARALPDVRDGLKPVHRRILYAMNELNLDPSKAYKKSARIVGDTMGKYHPHGDSSIYDAMVRMAQDFSIRYPLVDGHGNFGSMDGDSAAAPRYTEARLSRIAMDMLADIEKDTVDFVSNYDGEFKEPSVLPSRFPNLLVNGSSGIAVGMATNIPPHNLAECIDALVLMLNKRIEQTPEADLSELIEIIHGPDFPTGASILGTAGIRQAYRTGRGKLTVRATAAIEPMPGASGRDMIVVTEIPYQVNKSRLVARIADLVKDKKVEGITDIRDESDRNGVRIVIDLRKDANSNVVLNNLYKFSSLQESFGIIMLALVKNEARILNIKQILEFYIEHQKDVILRRTRFELAKAEKRAHILQGYLIALDHLDEVLAIIRGSQDGPSARAKLTERFELSDEQSNAIVEMRLRSLTGLERGKIEAEFSEIQLDISRLNDILQDDAKLFQVMRDELIIMRKKYGDERRTQILNDPGEIVTEDLISDESCVITMTHLGYIKRIALNAYKSQNRGGKGIIGMQTRDEDLVNDIFVANTHDRILFFTNMGRVYRMKAFEIPESGRTARGMAIVNMLKLNENEKIAAVIPLKKTEASGFFVLLTKRGIIKKMSVLHSKNILASGRIMLAIKEGDELISVLRTDGAKDLFIATAHGMGIRFSESQIRASGRQSFGIKAMKLKDSDSVVSAGVVSEDGNLLFVSKGGYGKRTRVSEFKLQSRNGVGLHVYKVTPKSGEVVGVCPVNDREELMLINSEGVIIRIRVSDISMMGRYTTGVKLIGLEPEITVVSIAKIAEDQMEQLEGLAGDDSDELEEAQDDFSVIDAQAIDALENEEIPGLADESAQEEPSIDSAGSDEGVDGDEGE